MKRSFPPCTQVAFDAALREAVRLLEAHVEQLQRGHCVKEGVFDEDLHQSTRARVEVLLERMSSELAHECERLGAWGVLGQGTGGVLMGTNGHPIPKSELMGKFLRCMFLGRCRSA